MTLIWQVIVTLTFVIGTLLQSVTLTWQVIMIQTLIISTLLQSVMLIRQVIVTLTFVIGTLAICHINVASVIHDSDMRN